MRFMLPMAMAASHALPGKYPGGTTAHVHGTGTGSGGKKLFRCPQCRYITDRKNNLKRHIGTMHQECGKLLECCDIVFPSKASLRDHVMLFHRAGYKCRFCARNFCRKALLKRHLLVHAGHRDFVCTICDFGTNNRDDMDRHKRLHQINVHAAANTHAQWAMFWNLGGVDLNGNNYLKSYSSSVLGRLQAGLLANRLQETYKIDKEEKQRDIEENNDVVILDENDNDEKDNNENNDIELIDSSSTTIDSNSPVDLTTTTSTNPLSKTNSARLCPSPYKCAECCRTFPNQPELITHAQHCRKNAPEPSCPLQRLVRGDMEMKVSGVTGTGTGNGSILTPPQKVDFIDTMKLLKAMGLDEEMSEQADSSTDSQSECWSQSQDVRCFSR